MNQGFFRAIVRENKDPEKMGRVRVEYPWFQGDSSERLSEWASVCMPYASKQSGFFFLPEVDDEVLVFVENGDLDHPLVFGALYTGQHPSPAAGREGDGNSNGTNDLKYLGTRSGHVLCFDDSSGNQGIVLRDKQNRRLEIQSKKNALLLSDADSNQITIAEGVITVQNSGGDKVVVEKNTIRIQSQNVKIEAAQTLELGTGASEALVKGQAFMALFNSHTHTAAGFGAPTSPPSNPMTPDQLSTKVKTV